LLISIRILLGVDSEHRTPGNGRDDHGSGK